MPQSANRVDNTPSATPIDISAPPTEATAKPRNKTRTKAKAQSPTTDNIDRAKEAGMANPGQSKPTDSIPDVLSRSSSAAMAAASAAVWPSEPADDASATIARPSSFSLDKFRSNTAANIGGVTTLLTAMTHHGISQAKDFVRLHPDEEAYWSPELCFVSVPIKGTKRDMMHLIEEELAMRYLPTARVQRFRLALATKPYDVFFLCHVPTRNFDNLWNNSNIQACEQARTLWVQVTSRKEEGIEGYKIEFARNADAFPPPRWPTQFLAELIGVTFPTIETEDHPALLRLIGAKPQTL